MIVIYDKILSVDLTFEESINMGFDLVDWIMEHIKGKYRIFYITIPNSFNNTIYHCPSVIWIYSKCDAMLFKIRWC